jgi:hypothetical protein
MMRNYRLSDFEAKINQSDLLVPLDVLLVGGTGTGKSSTMNALFGSPIAKVGDGVDPETQEVSAYSFHDYLRIHDSAGLGDGKEADLAHAKNITYQLLRTVNLDGGQFLFMDLVIVLLDGGSRDMGTAFKLLEQVVLKNIEPERVIVAINQADMAMKGRYWNQQTNQPEAELKSFLDEKALSTQIRIKESTGLNIRKPIYYSAKHHYNLNKFYDHILEHIPKSRRKT